MDAAMDLKKLVYIRCRNVLALIIMCEIEVGK